MSWNWRKSLRFGPFKINLSKSGVGYSLGLPGYRLGTDAKGKKYQQVSVPGTGIYRRDYSSAQSNAPGQPSSTSWFAAPKLYVIGLVFLAVLWALIKILS
jgi:hypothetical protein